MKKFKPFKWVAKRDLHRLAELINCRQYESWIVATVMAYLPARYQEVLYPRLNRRILKQLKLDALQFREYKREEVVALDKVIREHMGELKRERLEVGFRIHPAAMSILEAFEAVRPEEVKGVVLTSVPYEKLPRWWETLVLLKRGTDVRAFYRSLRRRYPKLAWRYLPVLFKTPGNTPLRCVKGRWKRVAADFREYRIS